MWKTEKFQEDTLMKRVIFTLFVILACSIPLFAKYSGGSGEPNTPYLIASAEDMNQIGRNFSDWDKCFKLIADINLSAYTGAQFSRIGTDDAHTFSGVFDGNGHKISGFTYTGGSLYIGVFGYINGAGRVENTSLVDVNIIGNSYVGGLVGYNKGTIRSCNLTGAITGGSFLGGLVGYNSNGSITNCCSTAIVTGEYGSYLGGLVGYSFGSISNCYSKGAVTGGYSPYYLGGLVGHSLGSISNCYSTSSVTGGHFSYYLGGLVGQSVGGTISDCNSTGDVTSGDNSRYLGGLVGQSYNPISDCNSTGAVNGGDSSQYLGGLAGQSDHGVISHCSSTGAVTGGYNSDYVGGLVGYEYYGNLTNCYTTGNVSGDYDTGGLVGMNDHGSTTRCYSSGSVSGYMYFGGLLGWNNEGTTTDSFWNTETSGQTWSAGGTGKTTAEMMTKSTFTDAGWDFFSIWDIVEDQTYPFFKSGVGLGTPDDPYRIVTKADLMTIAADISYYDKYFILMADINMEEQIFTTAIFSAGNFTGAFDGNDYKITNFTINGAGDLGLFSSIGYNGSIENLGFEKFSISGSYYVGALAGGSNGNINNCYSAGTVYGSYSVGGLVGSCQYYGTISNCYSRGTVNGSYSVGGLVGFNDGGAISKCYSTSNIIGLSYLGGLVGGNGNSGTINNCYSTGTVRGNYDVGGLAGQSYGSIAIVIL
jgi:hypothetical protein